MPFTVKLSVRITGRTRKILVYTNNQLRLAPCRENYSFRTVQLREIRDGPGFGPVGTTVSPERDIANQVTQWIQREGSKNPQCHRELARAANELHRAAVNRVLRRGMRAAWLQARSVGRRVCPVDTGRLRASLGCNLTVRGTTVFIQMASNVPYADLVRDNYATTAVNAGVQRFNRTVAREARNAVRALT